MHFKPKGIFHVLKAVESFVENLLKRYDQRTASGS